MTPLSAYDVPFGGFYVGELPDGLLHDCIVDGQHYNRTRVFYARCGQTQTHVWLHDHKPFTCLRCIGYMQEKTHLW